MIKPKALGYAQVSAQKKREKVDIAGTMRARRVEGTKSDFSDPRSNKAFLVIGMTTES